MNSINTGNVVDWIASTLHLYPQRMHNKLGRDEVEGQEISTSDTLSTPGKQVCWKWKGTSPPRSM